MSSIKLKHSGGNSVSLNPPTSAPTSSEVAFKLPNADGSTGQFMKTDGSGNLSFAAPVGGKILQVKQTIKTDKFETTSTSYTDITNLNVSITPASTSNKILVLTNVRIGAGTGNADNKYRIYRGSTAISDENFCRLPQATENFMFSDIILDSPGVATQLTYKVRIKAETNEVFVGRDNSDRYYGASSITVMEVSA